MSNLLKTPFIIIVFMSDTAGRPQYKEINITTVVSENGNKTSMLERFKTQSISDISI